jgi:hypothetical protein
MDVSVPKFVQHRAAHTVLGEHGKLVIREPEHIPADRREIGQQALGERVDELVEG